MKNRNDSLRYVEGDRKPVPLLRTPANEGLGVFSPGPGPPRWIAYQSAESGAPEIYVMFTWRAFGKMADLEWGRGKSTPA